MRHPVALRAVVCASLVSVCQQTNTHAQSTTVRESAFASRPDIVTLLDIWRVVTANHPEVRQALAAIEQVRADARTARGAYDPTISATWEQKVFGGTQYYDYLRGTASVPTPLGFDVKLSYESAAGRYINPERRTAGSGLLSVGISAPFGQRLVVDDRRTAVNIAREAEAIAQSDLQAARNRVVLDATKDYARWLEATQRVTIAREGLSMAESRLAFTRSRVRSGEAPPLDTLEALLETQRRTSTVVESEQTLKNARAIVSLHLWDAGGRRTDLPPDAVPSFPQLTVRRLPEASVADFARRHPAVGKSSARLVQARTQQRQASLQRIPVPAFELYGLSSSDQFPLSNSAAVGWDNTKRGASLTLPLLSLKERGRAASTAARATQAAVDLDRVERSILASMNIALGDLDVSERMAALQRNIVEHSATLVRGENIRYQAGESTLLTVMIRERALLDEQLKLAALEARVVAGFGERVALTGEWRVLLPDSE